MKRTHTVLAALAVATLALAPAAFARGGRDCRGGPSPERAAERLARRLDLSAEQQEQVQTILEQSFADRQELRERHQQEMDAMREATDEQLAAVLTGEQMEELAELRERRRERWEDRGMGPHRDGRGPRSDGDGLEEDAD